MEGESEDRLYVPVGVKTQKEIIPGFQVKDLISAVILGLIFIVIGVLIYFLFHHFVIAALTALGGAFFSFVIFAKTDNISVVNYLLFAIDYYKSQNRFYYRYMNEWEKK